MADPGRVVAIDVLKAVAGVTVVWIHAFGEPWDLEQLPVSAVLTSFAVPTFFFASGFLHHRSEPITAGELARWLARVIVPYLVASTLALCWRSSVGGEHLGMGDALFALATGSAWGIYYFVPVLVGALLLGTLLSRTPWLTWPLGATFWITAFAGFNPLYTWFGLFWLFRSPFPWWGYFLAGWLVARHRRTIAALPAERRRLLASLALGVFAVIALVGLLPGSWRGLVNPPIWVANNGAIAALFIASLHARRRSLVEFVSTASYPLYLYHWFFVAPLREHSTVLGPLARPLAFLAGCLGGLAVVAVARSVLGRRARSVIG